MTKRTRTRPAARVTTLAAVGAATVMGLVAAPSALAGGTAAQGDHQKSAQKESAEKSAHKESQEQNKRPVWAIAHRVLTTGGVNKALDHGANAIEIDATAWKKGWWADHDGTPTSSGDTMGAMFDRIAEQRRAGKNINFVWLDLKNPDHCKSGDAKEHVCSLNALRDLAREKLEPAGVRVLYGFYGGTQGGEGWKDLTKGGLTKREGVDISGDAADVKKGFEQYGAAIPHNQRVMDSGLFNLNLPTVLKKKTEQLRLGAEMREKGEVKSTFGWTTAARDGDAVQQLLSEDGGNADGLIYGHRASCYPDGVSGVKGCGKDESSAQQAIGHIGDFVRAHEDTRRMATTADVPFGS
ncbi:phospholipase [Streptomyces sp. ODS28]|uniref:phospholipase n=1 Tax=Streptomyces sp. ODS28 TaxID=3136688 RepID=UPI0031E63834